MMKNRKINSVDFLFVFFFVCEMMLLFISSKEILIDGPWSHALSRPEYVDMLSEILLLFVLIFIFVNIKNNIICVGGIMSSIAIFLWAHMIFIPAIVVSIYFIVIALIGKTFVKQITNRQIDSIVEFAVGCIIMVFSFCLLSLFHIGSIQNLRIFTLVIGTCAIICNWKEIVNYKFKIQNIDSIGEKVCISGIIIFVLIQFGRANIALDYDSMWYGLRPEYVLDAATGIYDKLNLSGLVYMYPKGFETLLLPISGTSSYGYIYCGNIIFLILILIATFKLLREVLNRESALMLVMLISGIPGIANMSVTAKSDISTIFFQMVAVVLFNVFIKKKQYIYMVLNLSILIFSYTLKPSSYLFTSIILFSELIYLFWQRKEVKKVINIKQGISLLILSITTLGLITLRTYLLTGLPFNICTNFLTKLGFQYKYPYGAGDGVAISNNLEQNSNLLSQIIEIGKRCFHFFVLPVTTDMDHIIIAWGTCAIILFLLIMFIGLVLYKVKVYNTFMNILTMLLVVANLFYIVSIVKPDGNTFMLFYMIIIVLGGTVAFQLFHEKKMKLFLIPLVVVNIILSSTTSWAWSVGFTPVSWNHKGYYSHKKIYAEEMKKNGKKIWNIIGKNPQARILTIGAHPYLLRIPAIVNGDIDITVWGNPDIFAGVENFEKYLDATDMQYIYIQNIALEDEGREAIIGLVKDYLNKKGYKNIIREKGNILIEICN